jgi:hypothetical protein
MRSINANWRLGVAARIQQWRRCRGSAFRVRAWPMAVLGEVSQDSQAGARLRVPSADVDAGEVELYALEVGGRSRRLHVGELVALHDVAAQACKQTVPKSAPRQYLPAATASAQVPSWREVVPHVVRCVMVTAV